MGMTQTSVSNKWCITCQFFGGTREATRNGHGISYEANQRAKCVGGGKNTQQVSLNGTCPKYAKWAALK